MSFIHFTLVLLFISFFCTKPPAAAAQCPPASSLPSCSSFFSANASWPLNSSNVTFPIVNTRSLTLFKQASLSLHTHQPSSFTFTSAFSDDQDTYSAPSLAFILVASQPRLTASPSSMQSMEIRFSDTKPCNPKPLTVCTPNNPPPQQTPQIQVSPNCSREPQSYDTSQTQFKDDVSLAYDANAATLNVQAIDYRGGDKTILNFNLSIKDLLPNALDSRASEDSITLYVGYITSGEGNINLTSEEGGTNVTTEVFIMNSASSPPMLGAVPTHRRNANSNHTINIVMWVLVGVSIVIFFVGLTIIVLSITKRRRGCPPLISSRPSGNGSPPSMTSGAPFPRHRLESSATPMISPPPLSPPYAFQISGTTSWLKQPNPR